MAFCSNIDQMAKFGGYILPNMRAALLLTYGSGIAARMANCGPRRPEWRSSPIAFMTCTKLSLNGCKPILDNAAVNAFGGACLRTTPPFFRFATCDEQKFPPYNAVASLPAFFR